MREIWAWSLGWEDPLEKGKALHSSILAWRIPCIVPGVAKSWTQLSDVHLDSLASKCRWEIDAHLAIWVCSPLVHLEGEKRVVESACVFDPFGPVKDFDNVASVPSLYKDPVKTTRMGTQRGLQFRGSHLKKSSYHLGLLFHPQVPASGDGQSREPQPKNLHEPLCQPAFWFCPGHWNDSARTEETRLHTWVIALLPLRMQKSSWFSE